FRHHVKKLLFLGSTCIYPREAQQPMVENCLLTSPLEYTNEPYAIAKIAGLKMCESYNLQYGTNYIAVMPTNLYGPNDNFHLENSHVMPAMIRKIFLSKCLNEDNWKIISADLNKRPIEGVDGSASHEIILSILEKYGIFSDRIELWGTGTPLRDFLWSEEMADACIYIMERVDFSDIIGHKIYSKSQIDANAGGDATDARSGRGGAMPELGDIRNCHINIGTGKEITIRQLAEYIVKTVNYHGKLVFDSSKPDGTMQKLTNPSKLHSLGWHHQIEVEEGINRLFQWYYNQLEK
ncbi:MAG: NAD-dependent epimerase/dehydratase family protein, partial [Bacteroidales bacterium]|nr:NAD-dependent epimerase/dehydratase family protein [Bacteroidales bacterium]